MRRLLLLAALLLPAAARAQAIAAYVTFSPAHLSNVETGAVLSTTSAAGYNEQTASYWAPGFGGGLTFNLIPVGPIRFGFDLRGSTKPGTSGADSALFGVKLGVHLPILKIKPYLQASAGYLDSRTINVSTPAGQTSGQTGGTFTNKYAAYEIMGGVDYPLFGPLDVRIIEVGGGAGIASGSYNPSFLTINSGIVLHF